MEHGHDIHFLERLERLSTRQTELALSLYRDPVLIRALLEHLRLPEQASRVALSLGDDACGPFVVVARDGHFVTCLGEGMAPTGLHVIPRSQLDAIAEHVGEVRVRMHALFEQARSRGGVVRLIDRVFTSGAYLGREELSAIAALRPLLGADLMSLLWVTRNLVDRLRPRAIKASKADKRGATDRDALHAWWHQVWALGHLSVLVTIDSRDSLDELSPDGTMRGLWSWPTVSQGIVAIALRGLWGVGKLGKPLLADYKRWYVESESSLEVLDSALGLLVIALRHRGLAAEARKALARTNRAATAGGPNAAAIQQIQSIVSECTPLVLDRPDDCARLRIGVGRSYARPKAGSTEELPEDLASLLAASSQATFLSSKKVCSCSSPACPGSRTPNPRTSTGPPSSSPRWTRRGIRTTSSPSSEGSSPPTARSNPYAPSSVRAATTLAPADRGRSTSAATAAEPYPTATVGRGSPRRPCSAGAFGCRRGLGGERRRDRSTRWRDLRSGLPPGARDRRHNRTRREAVDDLPDAWRLLWPG